MTSTVAVPLIYRETPLLIIVYRLQVFVPYLLPCDILAVMAVFSPMHYITGIILYRIHTPSAHRPSIEPRRIPLVKAVCVPSGIVAIKTHCYSPYLCNSMPWLGLAMPLLVISGACSAVALPSWAMPPHIAAVLCLCAHCKSVPLHFFPAPQHVFAELCRRTQCRALAMYLAALPLPRPAPQCPSKLCHCLAMLCPRCAMLFHALALPCSELLCHCFSFLRRR